MYNHLYDELLDQKRKAQALQEAGRTSHSDIQHFLFHIDEQFKILQKHKPSDADKNIVISSDKPLIQRVENWKNLRSSENELLDEFDPESSYHFIIPVGKRTCFSEVATRDNELIRGAYYVSSGDNLLVAFKVRNSRGTTIREETNSESVFKYQAVYYLFYIIVKKVMVMNFVFQIHLHHLKVKLLHLVY